jgi:phytoene/squalene synthetase
MCVLPPTSGATATTPSCCTIASAQPTRLDACCCICTASRDARELARSDAICTALQLINFWQDVRIDVARARWYPSVQTMARYGVQDTDLLPTSDSRNATRLIATYAQSARAMMHEGAPLVHNIRGRAGWELRLVVQGGLRILDKIEALGFATWRIRPKLTPGDAPIILWRALWM